MKKRIISLLLALCMVLNFAPVSVVAETDDEEPGETYTPAEEDGVYLLDSEEALLWLAEQVNGGNGALRVRLTDNIALSGEWTPIGTEDNPFSGSFDGDGYTISGLSIEVELESDSATVYLGLFGSVEGESTTNRAEICDLTVEGSVEVGDALTATNQGGSYVGGIVGRAVNADISGVVSKVEVNNAKDVSDSKTNATGGIVGDAYDVHFTNCGNEGSVYSNNDYVGGITSGRVFTADSCYNSGTVSGVKRIGGIAGYTLNGTYSCEITNCYNIGMVIGDAYAGGIVGWMFYAYGADDACTVENCYSTGWVLYAGTDGYSYNGTLVGCNNGGDTYEVINCYATSEPAFGTNASSAASAQVIGDDELKALAETLGDSFKPDYGNVNDGFPVLSWQESECAHEETETVYKSNDNGTHTVTVTCVNCGEAQGNAEAEDCVDEDEDGKCDKCEYEFPAEIAVGTVNITAEPENALICLVDSYGERILPNEDGSYNVTDGYEYTCTVTAPGYVGQSKSFTAESGMDALSFTLVKAEENTEINTDLPAEWPNFRNGSNHLGIVDAKTPYDPDDAELLWAVKYGTGWSAAPGSPILVDDCIITYIGSSIKKLDKNTGEVLAEGKMVGSSNFSMVPATYAEGMVFVGLSGGRIQAFNAETLESLWVYTDALKGQPNCPITYQDGYVYAGFWNSETKDANFACISVTDENPDETTEAKLASWTYCRAGGFYWAGAYVSENGKYVVVGTDDGASGYTTDGASLLVFEAATGKLVDSWDGIRGDIRSNVSHDPESDRVFFTSKGGVLCNAKIDWETGEISDTHITVITDANGNEYAMSTCTPSVYNGRIYIGVSGKSQFGASSGHGIAVYSLEEDGEMTQAYVYDIVGYPQTSAMVSVGYVTDEDDSVYIYLPYNAKPGGVSVLKDAPGQTEPIATTGEGYSEVFTPVSPLDQYCICSTIADSYGTIYYKNDSCYMMAITSKILSLEASKDIALTYDRGSGKLEVTSGSLYVTLKNGLTRDVSDYVTYDRENGQLVYTYGFDNANYGLKTVTLDWCFHADMERTYTPVEGKEGVQHTANIVCSTCGSTVKETVNCADLDKNGLCDDCGAKMADAGLKLQEGDTFSELVSWYPIDGTAEALSVSATSNYPNGKLSYQWYYTEKEGSYANPTLVENATESSFVPSADVETNMRFYFCVVTLTVGENSWTTKSAQQAVIVCPQPTATVYFSLTDDEVYVVGDNGVDGGDGGSGEVMAMKEITVPYFDLALYGLEDFYFVSETYGQDEDNPGQHGSNLTPGNSTYAFGKITALHLYLYAMEVHYCGLDEAEAGKGYLYDAGLLGSDALMISGSSGSLYMNRFWGHDENLTYYVNYAYPLASAGWGSTSDQILLEDGDIVSVSMYSSWSMFADSGYGYHHLGTESDQQMTEISVSVGTDSLELTLYRACVDDWMSCTTAQVVVTDGIDVYYADASDLPGGKVTAWKKAGTTDENGKITLNFSELNLEQGKTYLFAVAGQKGADYTDDIVSCPGGILVKMLKPASGDVNGDGFVDLKDVLQLQRYVANLIGADKLNVEAADMNGDGIIDLKDVLKLQQYVAGKN